MAITTAATTTVRKTAVTNPITSLIAITAATTRTTAAPAFRKTGV
jgi:hypothetical protein